MNEDVKIELYKLFREEKHKSLDLHLQTFKHFLTLITAISGATIAGLANFQSSLLTFNVILFAGSFLTLISCLSAIKMCNLFYRGMLEGITVMAKLEVSLGLKNRTDCSNESEKTEILFPDDSTLLPQRWIEGLKEYKTTKEFITSLRNKGINHYVHIVLYIFMIICAICLFFALYGIYSLLT